MGNLRRGDQDAFDSFVRKQWAPMTRVARLYVSSNAVAEEVVQDTWLAVLQGLDGFEGRSTLKTWLYRILVNLARTRGEREKRTVPFSSLPSSSTNDTGSTSPAVEPRRFRRTDAIFNGHWEVPPTSFRALPESRLIGREMIDVIQQAIARLPLNQQGVVWLRDVEGWTADEVCHALALSAANQRVLLHRARSKVRGVVEAYVCGAASEVGP